MERDPSNEVTDLFSVSLREWMAGYANASDVMVARELWRRALSRISDNSIEPVCEQTPVLTNNSGVSVSIRKTRISTETASTTGSNHLPSTPDERKVNEARRNLDKLKKARKNRFRIPIS